jgi:hypothetical protein
MTESRLKGATGIDKIVLSYQELNAEDTSPIALTLRGVFLGTFRNDIYCKWVISIGNAVVDLETYILYQLKNAFHVPTDTAKDVLNVEQVCMKKTGMNVAKWWENFMMEHTDDED